jgi:hypothetical protein
VNPPEPTKLRLQADSVTSQQPQGVAPHSAAIHDDQTHKNRSYSNYLKYCGVSLSDLEWLDFKNEVTRILLEDYATRTWYTTNDRERRQLVRRIQNPGLETAKT